MANILYLVHRLPYPPNKGDKVRSYHLLKHLARKHRVFLGTFIDDPEDEVHVATVRALCADLHVSRLRPRLARAASLNALLSGDPLTLRYYRSAAMADWVKQTCSSTHIDAAVIFSSAMAQYVEDFQPTADPHRLRRCRFGQVDPICAAPPLAPVLALPPGRPPAAGLRAARGFQKRPFLLRHRERGGAVLPAGARMPGAGRSHVQWRRCRLLLL